MKKETKKEIAKSGVTIVIGGTILAGVLYLGKNYRLQNPFVRIDNHTNDDHIEREIPTWKEGVPYSYTHSGTIEKPEDSEVTVGGVEETTNEVKDDTPVSSSSTVTSSVYAYTDEEIQAMFPPVVIDNSNHVLSESTVVISEKPGQITSMTSSISGGEVISEKTEITYNEVTFDRSESIDTTQRVCTEGRRR